MFEGNESSRDVHCGKRNLLRLADRIGWIVYLNRFGAASEVEMRAPDRAHPVRMPVKSQDLPLVNIQDSIDVRCCNRFVSLFSRPGLDDGVIMFDSEQKVWISPLCLQPCRTSSRHKKHRLCTRREAVIAWDEGFLGYAGDTIL